MYSRKNPFLFQSVLLPQMPKRARSTDTLSHPTRPRRKTRAVLSSKQSSLQRDLQCRLLAASDADYKEWLGRYLKGASPALGLKLGSIEKVVKNWADHHDLSQADPVAMKELAYNLFQLPHEEEKQAAIMFLHNTLQKEKHISLDDMPSFARLFDEGWVTSWSVCDSFSSTVLRGLIKHYRDDAVQSISAWRDSRNLWRARASVVGLFSEVKKKEEREIVLKGCEVLMKRDERFAKTAVGWALREIAKHDQQMTRQFLERNIGFLTVESVKNATRKFEAKERDQFLAMLKESG